jgi:DNA-binding beta-propeller fold protein YncE
MARPTKLPEWASGASAEVTEPSEAKKDLGWVSGGEKPPHDVFNWWQELVYDWLSYIDSNMRWFSLLGESAQNLVLNGLAWVDEYTPGTTPLSTKASYSLSTTSTSPNAENQLIRTDGQFVYVAIEESGGDELHVIDRDTGTFIDSLTWSSSIIRAIHSDGARVFVALEGSTIGVSCYDIPDRTTGFGTEKWFWNHATLSGTTVQGVYSDGNAVFACGDEDSANNSVFRLNRDTGAVVWDIRYGTTGELPDDVMSDGVRVYVCGADIPADSAGIRALNYSTGASEDTYDFAGSATFNMCQTRDHVYVHQDRAGSDNVVKLKKSDLTKVWGADVGGAFDDVNMIATDGRFLYAALERATATYSVAMMSLEDGRVVHSADIGASQNGRAVDADVSGVFVLTERDGSNNQVFRLNTLAKPVVVKKMAGTERWRSPLHHIVVSVRGDETA